jgi:hypothetical protein
MNNRISVFTLWLISLVWLFLLREQSSVDAQSSQDVVYIFTPQPGQALQGVIPIEVSLIVSKLEVATLEFRYERHPTDTWFLIAQVTESIPDGVMAQWDTTTITDGEYDLRLQAITMDQQSLEYIVPGIRVRNYSAIETETPTPFVPTETLLPGQGTPKPPSTETPLPPTTTPLPTNPAIFTTEQFSQTFTIGSLASIGVFLLLGLYVAVRTRLLRRS